MNMHEVHHGGAPPQEGSGFKPAGKLELFCVEFAFSPYAGFLQVLWFPPAAQKTCRLGLLAILNCP